MWWLLCAGVSAFVVTACAPGVADHRFGLDWGRAAAIGLEAPRIYPSVPKPLTAPITLAYRPLPPRRVAVDTWVEAGSGTFDQVRQEGRLTTESSGDGLVWTLEIGLKGEGGAPPGPRHTVRVETDSAGRLRGRPPELPVLRSADGATAAVPDPYGAVPPWPLPTGPVVQGGEFTRFEVPVPTEMRVNGAWVLLEPAPGGPGAPPARIAVTGTVLGEVNFLGRPALVVGFAGETAMRFGRAVYSGYAVHDIETGAAQTSVSQLAVAGWHRGGVVPAHQAVTLRFQPE